MADITLDRDKYPHPNPSRDVGAGSDTPIVPPSPPIGGFRAIVDGLPPEDGRERVIPAPANDSPPADWTPDDDRYDYEGDRKWAEQRSRHEALYRDPDRKGGRYQPEEADETANLLSELAMSSEATDRVGGIIETLRHGPFRDILPALIEIPPAPTGVDQELYESAYVELLAGHLLRKVTATEIPGSTIETITLADIRVIERSFRGNGNNLAQTFKFIGTLLPPNHNPETLQRLGVSEEQAYDVQDPVHYIPRISVGLLMRTTSRFEELFTEYIAEDQAKRLRKALRESEGK